MIDAPETPMDEAMYVSGCEVLVGLAGTVQMLPVSALRSFNERAQTLAPILDPTAFMRGGDNLRQQRLLIDAFLAVQRAVEQLAGEAASAP